LLVAGTVRNLKWLWKDKSMAKIVTGIINRRAGNSVGGFVLGEA
jgi:hypothetical protein